MTDVVARAKAALEADEIDDRRHGFCEVCGEYVGDDDDQFGVAARSLIPELVAELESARAELALTRDGYQVRAMTETESNLMTQVLDLRREVAQLRAVADQGAKKPPTYDHDEQCEADFIEGAYAWTECRCEQRAAAAVVRVGEENQ